MQEPYSGTNLPYPDGQVTEKDPAYAALLMPLLAGRNGKETALNQYLYQYWLTVEDYPALAMSLEAISADELQHLRLLGELVTALGGDPLLKVGGRQGHGYYWTGEFVSTEKSIPAFLRNDIAMEQAAIGEYDRRIKAIDDPYVRDVLARIIADEQQHLRVLREYEALLASYDL